MITVISGLPGAGKSLKLARIIVGILHRNKKYFEKTGIRRHLYTNLALSRKVVEEYEPFIQYWEDTRQLTELRDCDVIWDELATAMDATQWQNMSLTLKRWLQQHRKMGIDIYGTAQDFSQVDKSFRRLTSHLIHLTKLIGSQDKSATRPDIRNIWGLCTVRELDPQQYNEQKSKFESKSLPSFMFISRSDIELYDTTALVRQGEYPPMRHIVRTCEQAYCDHVKVQHV